jgi:hypothetical protein
MYTIFLYKETNLILHFFIRYIKGKLRNILYFSTGIALLDQILSYLSFIFQPTPRAKLGSKAFKSLKKGQPVDDQVQADILVEAIRYRYLLIVLY